MSTPSAERERVRRTTAARAAQSAIPASTASLSPAMRLLDRYLRDAAESGASDLHLETSSELALEPLPQERFAAQTNRAGDSKRLRVRLRVDGRLRDLEPPPPHLAASLLTRLRLMARVDLSERRLPQDGRFAFRHQNRVVDVRAAFVPVHSGEKVAMRFLRRNDRALSLEEVGFASDELNVVRAAIASAGGLVIIAGPTGSGKTTTAYAMIDRLQDPELATVTAEDPVERTLAGVAQIAIDEECGRTFSKVLRGILRLDPDILMIGEIRDAESAQIACRAALTGHSVVTTLHAGNTREAWIRMVDIGVPEPLLSATVKLIVTQRLLRRICVACRASKRVGDPEREIFRSAGVPSPEFIAVQRACDQCGRTGFNGRFPVFEIHDRSRNTADRACRTAEQKTLVSRALRSVADLDTTLEEALSQCPAASSDRTRGIS